MKTTILQAGLLFLAATAFAGDLEPPIPGLPPGADSSPEPSIHQRLAATRHLHVPLPTKTPFDADPEARLEYRRGYRKGYRFGMAGCYNIILGSSTSDAFHTGFYAGRDAGTLMLSKGYAAPSVSN